MSRRQAMDAGKPVAADGPTDTLGEAYAQRLVELQTAGWKRLLHVQAPYRRYLLSLRPGVTLDLGCGVGRTLAWLGAEGVGIDHNERAVAACRLRGLVAMTPDEFTKSAQGTGRKFESLLLAHVIEHMERADGAKLIASYLPYLKPGGQVIVITPQERGYASDASHVRFADFSEVVLLLEELGLRIVRRRSFPFPRVFGRLFVYNEFVVVARLS